MTRMVLGWSIRVYLFFILFGFLLLFGFFVFISHRTENVAR